MTIPYILIWQLYESYNYTTFGENQAEFTLFSFLFLDSSTCTWAKPLNLLTENITNTFNYLWG